MHNIFAVENEELNRLDSDEAEDFFRRLLWAEARRKGTERTVDLFEEVQEFISNLGDNITESPRKLYIAYRTIRNFACVEIHKKRCADISLT